MAITEKDLEAIGNMVSSAIKEEVKEFYVDRVTHYEDHTWVKFWRKTNDLIRVVAIRTTAAFIVIGVLGLLVAGYWSNVN